MASRKSQTVVTLNAKLSNVDLQTIPYNGEDRFLEGAPVIISPTTGLAARPTGGATKGDETVYINFVDSNRTDVIDVQGDPFQDALPALKLGGSGHLTGIRGSGIDIGLPASCWVGGALPTIGQGVFVATTADNNLWSAKTVTTNDQYYGIIERIAHGRAHFFFTSRPIPAKLA